MKILFTLLTVAVMALSGKAYAQSNVTWTFNDKSEARFFMSHTSFSITMSNITQAEAAQMYAQIKSNKDVASCSIPVKNAAGNYNISLTMNAPHEGKYYAGWAEKMGVSDFVIGDKTKKLSDMHK